MAAGLSKGVLGTSSYTLQPAIWAQGHDKKDLVPTLKLSESKSMLEEKVRIAELGDFRH